MDGIGRRGEYLVYLTFTILWANSADAKLVFLLFFPENRIWYFMQIVSSEHNLHEMSKPVFWEIKEKYIKMSSAENFTLVFPQIRAVSEG